jgi:hypothetical protein
MQDMDEGSHTSLQNCVLVACVSLRTHLLLLMIRRFSLQYLLRNLLFNMFNVLGLRREIERPSPMVHLFAAHPCLLYRGFP